MERPTLFNPTVPPTETMNRFAISTDPYSAHHTSQYEMIAPLVKDHPLAKGQRHLANSTTETLMRSFHFPGTTVNFTHAIVTPGHVRYVESGFNFTAAGQPFLWTNPDLCEIVPHHEAFKAGTVREGAVGSGLESSCNVDSARNGNAVQQPWQGQAINDAQPRSQLPGNQSVMPWTETPGPSLPVETILSTIDNNLPAIPAVTRYDSPYQNPLAAPPNVPTTSRPASDVAQWGSDGTSALSGWYAENIDVARAGTAKCGGWDTSSTIAQPTISARAVMDHYIDLEFDFTPCTNTLSSHSATQNPKSFGNNVVTDQWNRQLPHTSHGVLNSRPLDEGDAPAANPSVGQIAETRSKSAHDGDHQMHPPVGHSPNAISAYGYQSSTKPATYDETYAQLQLGAQHAMQQNHAVSAQSPTFAFGAEGAFGDQVAQSIEREHAVERGYSRLQGYARDDQHYPMRHPAQSVQQRPVGDPFKQPGPWALPIALKSSDMQTSTANLRTVSHAPRPHFVNAWINESFVFPPQAPLTSGAQSQPTLTYPWRSASGFPADYGCPSMGPVSMVQVDPAEGDRLSDGNRGNWSARIDPARSELQSSYMLPSGTHSDIHQANANIQSPGDVPIYAPRQLPSSMHSKFNPGTTSAQVEMSRKGRHHVPFDPLFGRSNSGPPPVQALGEFIDHQRPATAQPSASITRKRNLQNSKSARKKRASYAESDDNKARNVRESAPGVGGEERQAPRKDVGGKRRSLGDQKRAPVKRQRVCSSTAPASVQTGQSIKAGNHTTPPKHAHSPSIHKYGLRSATRTTTMSYVSSSSESEGDGENDSKTLTSVEA